MIKLAMNGKSLNRDLKTIPKAIAFALSQYREDRQHMLYEVIQVIKVLSSSRGRPKLNKRSFGFVSRDGSIVKQLDS